MKTLVVGDSFVYNRIPTYALFLKKIEPDVTIKGLIGGGNDIISYQLLCEFEKYDRFIINWTSTCRYDVLVSDETKKKFFERNSNHHVVNESYFINSGGWRGLWYRQSGKKLFDSMYKYHFDIENSWRVTLEYMLMVHKLLEGKPHIHFFSYDTFEAQDFGQYEKKDRKERVYNKQKWQNFLNKNKWTNLIDWDKVWFHKNEYTNTGGIMDWCHDNTLDDGHHPTERASREFVHKVLQPWLAKNT